MKKSVLKPELNWLSNPEVFRVNRMDAHSDHFVYESEEAYKNNKSSLFQSLNGQWDFAYANKPAERMADFYKMDFSTEKFDKINVPGHISFRGTTDVSILIQCILGMAERKCVHLRYQKNIILLEVM